MCVHAGSHELVIGCICHDAVISGFAGLDYFFENNSQDVLLYSDLKDLYPVLLKSRMQSSFTNMFAGLRQQLVSQLPEAMQGVVSKQFDAAQNQLLTKWFDWLPHLRRRYPLCDMRAS